MADFVPIPANLVPDLAADPFTPDFGKRHLVLYDLVRMVNRHFEQCQSERDEIAVRAFWHHTVMRPVGDAIGMKFQTHHESGSHAEGAYGACRKCLFDELRIAEVLHENF